MRALILVRHGLAGSNRDGTASCTVPGEGLTAEGVEQARRLGALLRGEAIDLGVASELLRTSETLELALAGRDVPRIVVPELNEIDFGSFDGGRLDDYRAWAAGELPTTRAPGGGESRADAAARFARGLRTLIGRPEGVVLVAGHALPIRYVLDAASGLAPAARMQPVEHAVPYRVCVRDARAAADLLEEWSAAPRFRVPLDEGRAGR